MAGLEPGARIVDRYRILGRLGGGGMGVVYLARDERLSRDVALKAVHGDQGPVAELRARLLREARTTAQLEHPSIVQIFDVGETAEGEAFVVMELVRGHTLRSVLDAWTHQPKPAASPPVEPLEAARIVAEVADPLGCAHRLGLVHRDVKPENIMVREDGRIALLDFGIAKALRPMGDEAVRTASAKLTPDGVILGTIAYLSPEQARASDVGAAADQFSLAVVAHELLTGEIPWNATHPMKILAKILAPVPAPVEELEARLPTPVAVVIARSLSRDAASRFASVEDFAEALAGGLAAASYQIIPSAPPPARRAAEEPSDPSGTTRGMIETLVDRVQKRLKKS